MQRGPEQHRQRREQVLDAARSCLAEHGLEALNMEMITTRAGLSTGTVYRLFVGKNDILASTVLSGLEGFLAAVQPLLDEQSSPLPLPVLTKRILGVAERPTPRTVTADLRPLVVHGWSHSLTDPVLRHRVRAGYADARHRFTRLLAGWQHTVPREPTSDPAELAQLLTSITLGFLAQRALIEDTDASAHATALACLARSMP